jgi:hypothetical protein
MNGDKSQPSQGQYDYWIVKINSFGIKLWDKRFGGAAADFLTSIKQTLDGGYILGGFSASGISGDKSQANWGPSPTEDFWIVKIDSLGVKQWDKDFGGTANEDDVDDIILTSDQGYLISGTSYSSISGDKTENNLGHEQTWLLKMDSLGNMQWDKTIFTNTGTVDDEKGLVVQSSPRCYTIANYTVAGIGGYKTQPSWGDRDYWIVKFCDSTFIESTSQLSINSSISIYPNPFTQSLTIKSHSAGKKEIILFDVTGKEILRQQISEAETKLNTEGIAAGFYVLKVGERNFKVIKQQ